MDVLILFILGLISYVLRLVLNVILANHMSTAMFGDYGVAIGVLTGLTTLLLLGSHEAVIKYVPLYKETGDSEKIRAFVKWNIRLILGVFLVYYLIIAAAIVIFFKSSPAAFLVSHMAMYFLVMAPVAAVAILIIHYMLGEDRIILSTTLDIVVRYVILIIVALTAVFFVSDSFTNEIIITAWIIVCLLIIALGLAALLSGHRNILSQVSTVVKAKIPAIDARAWYRDSIGLAILGTVYALGGYLDLYIVELIGVNEDMVGLYVAILAITEFFFIFPSATSKFVIPHINKMFLSPEHQADLQKRINTTNFFNVVLAVALASVIIIFREPILATFGPEYVAASLPLVFVVIGVTMNAIGDLPDQLLTYAGYENQVTIFIVAEVLTLIGVGTVLCYFYGLLGLSVATLISLSLRLVLCYWLARKKLPVKSLTIM